jgi:hypothetical protein
MRVSASEARTAPPAKVSGKARYPSSAWSAAFDGDYYPLVL